MRHRSEYRPRRLADPRGTVLVICLMLMLVVSFLAGFLLLMARSEVAISSTSRGAVQAATAAEYGLELAMNSLNPLQAGNTGFADTTLGSGMSVTAGHRDRTSAAPVDMGTAPCPAGYSMTLGCAAYTFAATGWARTGVFTSASTQLEASAGIYRGCNTTEYSC